jgi:hypothetical protein
MNKPPFWRELVDTALSYMKWGYGILLLSGLGYGLYSFRSTIWVSIIAGLVAGLLGAAIGRSRFRIRNEPAALGVWLTRRRRKTHGHGPYGLTKEQIELVREAVENFTNLTNSLGDGGTAGLTKLRYDFSEANGKSLLDLL